MLVARVTKLRVVGDGAAIKSAARAEVVLDDAVSEFARKIVHENPDCRNGRDGFDVGYEGRRNGGGGWEQR